MGLADRRDVPLPPTGRADWLPYHRSSIGDAEIAEVVDTLRSGWLTTGSKTKRFEQDFARRLGVGEALALSSCTAALQIALRVCGVGPGDDVVVPTYTFTATAEVVTHLGARPVLADVDPTTCNLDAASVARALTPRTKAVVPVHIGGLPCAMDEIIEVARAHDLAVIEDAAHALPGVSQGRPLGTIGDAGAFSFYATKNITTGEGGMLVVRDPDRAEEARLLALHGMSRDAWKRYSSAGQWRYRVVANGYKSNLDDVASSLGIHQLARLDAFHARRRAIAARYRRGLGHLEAIALPAEAAPGDEHAWHLYMIRVRPGVLGIGRDAFIEELRVRNIGTSVHFIPLHLHPYYQRAWGYAPGDLPGAEQAFADVLSLPLYPAMTDDDVDDVVAAVVATVRAHAR